MSNVTTGDPFILDTATDTAIFTDDFHCYLIAWTSATIADALSIQDQAGTVKFAGTSAAGPNIVPFNPPLRFNGLKVPTLGAGKVYMYVKVLG